LFLPDGTVHLGYIDYSLPQEQQYMIYDLNDNLLWQGKDIALPDKYLKWSNSTRYSMNYDYMISRIDSVYPEPRKSVIVPVLNDRQILVLWRYNYIKGYFEGFDKNGNIIGYCGSDGFTKEKSQLKPLEKARSLKAWMPVQGGGPIMMWADKNDIFQIDFRKQTFQMLLHLPDKKIRDIFMHNWMELSHDEEYYQVSEGYRPILFCRTEDNSVYVILRDPNKTFEINIPEDSNIYVSNVTATHDKIYMRATYSSLIPPKEIDRYSNAFSKWLLERMKEPIERSEKLYEVDFADNINLISEFDWTSPPRQLAQSSVDPTEKFQKLLSKFSPVFYDPLSGLANRFLRRLSNNYYQGLLDDSLYFMIQFALSYSPTGYLLSLFMAGIVFLHGWPRRKSIVSLIGWIGFAFLFNIVGLLVYLALNYTPTIKCHNCNKRRGLNTPQCPRCGADLSITVPGKLSIITET